MEASAKGDHSDNDLRRDVWNGVTTGGRRDQRPASNGVALANATTRAVGGEGGLRTVGPNGRVECAKNWRNAIPNL